MSIYLYFLMFYFFCMYSEFVIEKQVSCERCTTDTNVSGGFDPIRNEVRKKEKVLTNGLPAYWHIARIPVEVPIQSVMG